MPTESKISKSSERPEFLKQLEQDEFDINEYLKSVLGREPYVHNAKRRWRFLVSFSRFIYEKKNNVVYIEPSLDITERVINELIKMVGEK